MEHSDLGRLRIELLTSVQNLSNRCLYQAAKWAAEAAQGLALEENNRHSIDLSKELERDSPKDHDVLAKAYFDCHEYDRCAYLLESRTGSLSIFIRLYAKYISGEKKKEEDQEGILTAKDSINPNQQIANITRELDSYSAQQKEEDPFLLYLYGIALLRQKNENEAITKLLKSVTLFPYNWSAWQELLCCIHTLEKLNAIAYRLPNHLMSRIFLVYAHQELFQHDRETLESLDSLEKIFPTFSFLKVQRALLHYHGMNYNESEKSFEQILTIDPHRLDDMDTYSNMLYVMEKRPKLAFLAQLASSTDKFRAETCCIIANYYSLKSEHEKAIVYFQRALILDRNCLSAWTLMGHEFVELKNTHAAIESYRRAVDANKKDFRAWYGLGQAYEVLDMHYYSLYYYQRAATLKPHDVRMWQALGNCYEKLDKIDEAIKAYKRALRASDMDPIILIRLARLYDRVGDLEAAASYMKLCLTEEASEGITEETSQARLWLAKYEARRANWAKALDYADKITRGSSNDIEEARLIVRDYKSRLRQK